MYRRLEDFKGDEAWDVIIELVDPIAEIATDEDVKKAITTDLKSAAKAIVKNHKAAATTVLAVLSERDPEELRATINPIDIMAGVLSILQDANVINLFLSQGLKMETSSGSASVNTSE